MPGRYPCTLCGNVNYILNFFDHLSLVLRPHREQHYTRPAIALSSVSIQINVLGCGCAQPSVFLDEHHTDHPSAANRTQGKGGTRSKADTITWPVVVRPEISPINISDLTSDVSQR
jgi:hypothetical protein